MASLMNRDYADKRFLRAAPKGMVRAAEGARERLSRVMLLAVLALYGFALATTGIGHQPDVAMTDPSVRGDRG